MEKELKYPLMILAAIIGIVFLHNNGYFGINLQTADIQFYNKPIIVSFTTTNFTDPAIEAYWNDVRLYEVLTYQANVTYTNITTQENYSVMENKTINQTIGYTKTYINSSYSIKLENINSEGLIKIKAVEGNHSEIKSVEVRKPYVNIKNNIPELVDRGKVWTIEITTFNPQGDILEAESVIMDVITPLNDKETFTLDKAGNTFTKVFNFEHDGNYQFKIHARKEGYETKEVTSITAVTKTEGVHPIVYVWVFGVGIIVILFIVRLLTRRKRK